MQKNATKILVLGNVGSGKTTVIQAVRSIHGLIDSEEFQLIFRSIQLLICRSMNCILKKMKFFGINFNGNNQEHDLVGKHFISSFMVDINYEGASLVDFWSCISSLWLDKNVKCMASCSILTKVYVLFLFILFR